MSGKSKKKSKKEFIGIDDSDLNRKKYDKYGYIPRPEDPDKDYYLKRRAKVKEIIKAREKKEKHMTQVNNA